MAAAAELAGPHTQLLMAHEVPVPLVALLLQRSCAPCMGSRALSQ